MKSFLSEFVYGGIDGIITTFSIVAGSVGGDLARNVILILGISNVLSDGYSMGVSRYLSAQTEIAEGLLKGKNPLISAIATFFSFVIIGLAPILPFFIFNGEIAKKISLFIAMVVFFFIGLIKGYYLQESMFLNGLQTFLIGLSAAGISYYVGRLIHSMYDVNGGDIDESKNTITKTNHRI
jgi:vacuolar iron transporter family protein